MAYVEDRLVYDADSHIHEPPGYAEDYADPSAREALREKLARFTRLENIDEAIAKQRDPEFRAKDEDEVLLRKNSVAIGAVLREDRPRALDLLGFAAQLVFTTSYLASLRAFDVEADVETAAALSRGHNRGIVDFCSIDRRLLPVSYMAISYAPMQTLATLIVDGVLDRFPSLKLGLIELGAAWLPGLMRSMDSAAEAFRRNEERLQNLSLLPSEFVRRQVRITPYPHEPAGWIVDNTAPEVPMFSSDYPHVEGGRNPVKRFGTSLEGCDETTRQAFFSGNFADLLGPTLDRVKQPAPA